jgi:hypothetical protein
MQLMVMEVMKPVLFRVEQETSEQTEETDSTNPGDQGTTRHPAAFLAGLVAFE